MATFRVFLTASFLFFATFATAQSQTPKFVQFNNFSATFEVPVGKTWIIHQVFSNFSAGIAANTDGTKTEIPVRIFIKTLNGDIKTDIQGYRFGPQLFQSNNKSATINYPIVFPEKTAFSLVIVKGNPGNCSTYDGSGYISYYEVTNQ
jgi:hypothetical protein